MEHGGVHRLRRPRALYPHHAGGKSGGGRTRNGYPKATLSRRLTALEQALNVRLARRTKKGVVPTEQGRQLFDHSYAAIILAEQAIAEVQDDRVALSGTVRISLPPDIAVAALAPALIQFERRHGGVVVDMTLDDRRVSLVEEGYDLVVRMGSLPNSDLMSRKIATLPRVLVASPSFLADHPGMLTPRDLGNLPALAIMRDAIAWELGDRDGARMTVHPRVEFAANRQTILVDAAIAGLGIANLPTFLVEDAVRAGQLIRALPGWEPSPVEMTALWQKDKITSRLVSAIVTEFAGVFDSGAPKS